MRTNSMRRAGASWSYLALRSPASAASVGWDVRNLASATGRVNPLSATTPISAQ